MNNTFHGMERYWQNWDQSNIAQKIDEYWNVSPFERDFRLKLVEHLKICIGAKAAITEIGCGSGLICQKLLEMNVVDPSTYQGGDISEKMLALARAKLPGINFNRWDIFNLPLSDKSQPNVICIHVLQHLPQVDKPLSELIRVTGKHLHIASWFSQAGTSKILFSNATGFDGVPFFNNVYDLNEFLGKIHLLSANQGRRVQNIQIHQHNEQNQSIHIVFE